MDDKTKFVLLKCARVYVSTRNWPKVLAEYGALFNEFPEDPFIVEPFARANYETGEKYKAKMLYEKLKSIYESKGEAEKAARVQHDIVKMFGEQPAA